MDFFILSNAVVNKISKYLLKLRTFFYKSFLCERYRIIKSPEKTLDIFACIKNITWETNYAPPIFECAKERIVTALFPEQNIYMIKNGCVCVDSDAVLTEKGVFWDKYNSEDFVACAKPSDGNVFSFNKDDVFVRRYKNEYFVAGRTLSMIGVWSYAYSHFLFQFLCKLYYAAEKGLFVEEITLLTDYPSDYNIEEIYKEFQAKYPKIKRKYALRGVLYRCEELMAIPSLANNYNECRYYLEYRFMTPNTVVDGLQKFLVAPLIKRVKDRPVKHKKIFLSRTNNRILNNNNEVEEFFRSRGFHFLECGNMTFEEKAEIFYHAEEIVAVHGSSLMNLIFCSKARCLVLVNSRYVTELLPYTLSRNKVKAFLHLSGYDDNADRRSNFTISLDKIERAYQQLVQGEYDIER